MMGQWPTPQDLNHHVSRFPLYLSSNPSMFVAVPSPRPLISSHDTHVPGEVHLPDSAPRAPAPNVYQTTFAVPLSCEACIKDVSTSLYKLDGIVFSMNSKLETWYL